MYETKIIKQFSKIPVFSLSDVNQFINNRSYSKKFLKRMIKNKSFFKIKKNLYTLHKDPFLISTFIIKPSYISGVSALSYYNLVTQIPNEIFCATQKDNTKFKFIQQINYFHTNYFFGFKKEKYENFEIFIAEPEKAIIDSISIIPISIFEEAFEEIDSEKMIEYLKKIKKSSLVKRIGFLMEKNGYNVYGKLKNFINYKYIFLEPLVKSRGKKDKKWSLIINI